MIGAFIAHMDMIVAMIADAAPSRSSVTTARSAGSAAADSSTIRKLTPALAKAPGLICETSATFVRGAGYGPSGKKWNKDQRQRVYDDIT